MTTFALVLGALLAVACVVFVSRPFLREPAPLFKKLGSTPAEEAAIVEAERERLGT